LVDSNYKFKIFIAPDGDIAKVSLSQTVDTEEIANKYCELQPADRLFALVDGFIHYNGKPLDVFFPTSKRLNCLYDPFVTLKNE
jgi:hypothetical protein